MDVLGKILRGDNLRPTRLHTESGDFVGVRALAGFFPAGASWLTNWVFKWKIFCPWWVWGAIRFVAKNLQSTDSVLEDGSGISSLWLAQRCDKVVSIEQSNGWKKFVLSRAAKRCIENLEVILTTKRDKILLQLFERTKWDVVVIDGLGDRVMLFETLLTSSLRPRMIIYDNTDRIRDSVACAKNNLQGYAKNVFRGFAPQAIHATETTVFVRDEDRW